MKKKNKIIYRIVWGISLFSIVVVSLAFSFKLYSNSYGMGTLILFGELRRLGIYKHEWIYSMVQFTNYMIMLFVNTIGHIFDLGIGERQNIHFYGITNIILCCTMLIIDLFKYGSEYISAYPEVKEIMFPITILIICITLINIFGYIFMIIKRHRESKQ